MHQKAAAKAAWTAAGLYRSRNPNLREFLKHVDTVEPDCWSKLADELRARHPQLLEQIVVPLWDTGDKLLRVNVIRHLNPSRKEENNLLDKLARKLDARDDTPELAAIARSSTPSALHHVAKRKDVAEPIRGLARQRLVVLAQEAADKAAESRETRDAAEKAHTGDSAPVFPGPKARTRNAKGSKRGKSPR